MNINKKEAKRLEELVTSLKKKRDTAVATNSNPVQVGVKELSDALYYLDMLREEVSYRVDHYIVHPETIRGVTYTQLELPGTGDEEEEL